LTLAIIVIVAIPVAAAAPIGAAQQRSYVVVMKAPPAVAYDGGIAGLPATRPAKGQKLNPGSAAVKRYQAHLVAQHNASLRRAGASLSAKLKDYTIALNGYAATLSERQAAAVRRQKSVATVQEDELQQPTTDSSRQALRLADGRPA
jgi:hypothetical protein